MEVDIRKLPLAVQRRLPMSIRTLKPVYDLEELPSTVRTLVEPYLEEERRPVYGDIFDLKPVISEYGDFGVIADIETLILKYFENFFLTLPGEYPFDPWFGCRLKFHLQTRDTGIRKELIFAEAKVVADVLAADLGTKIEVEDVAVSSRAFGAGVEYNLVIGLRINNRHRTVNVTVLAD